MHWSVVIKPSQYRALAKPDLIRWDKNKHTHFTRCCIFSSKPINIYFTLEIIIKQSYFATCLPFAAWVLFMGQKPTILWFPQISIWKAQISSSKRPSGATPHDTTLVASKLSVVVVTSNSVLCNSFPCLNKRLFNILHVYTLSPA